MSPEQALQFLAQLSALAPAAKAAHVQAETAVKILAEFINKEAKTDGK